jgi:hypothetical protein
VVLWKVLGHGHSETSLNALISSIEALIDTKIAEQRNLGGTGGTGF